MTRWIPAMLAILILMMPGAAALAAPASAPAFACAGTRGIEAAICADTQLSAYDRQVADLYAQSRRAAFGSGPSQQLEAQRAWLKRRNDCKDSAPLVDRCLESTYRRRIHELARAAIFTAPDAAFAALRQVEPDAEPMYRAMFLYTTIEDPKKRAAAVRPLVKPFYDRNGGDGSYFRAKIPTLNDVPTSARNFGLFVAWTWLGGSYSQIAWPCGVLKRRPDLIETLGPLWGGSGDVKIPDSDCREMAPASKGLTNLIIKAKRDAPNCDGTYIFTTGRAYGQLEAAVRLHRTKIWSEYSLESPTPPEQVFRSTNAKLIAKAKVGLGA